MPRQTKAFIQLKSDYAVCSQRLRLIYGQGWRNSGNHCYDLAGNTITVLWEKFFSQVPKPSRRPRGHCVPALFSLILRTLPRGGPVSGNVSHLVHSQTYPQRRLAAAPGVIPYWQIAVLVALSLWLYWATLAHLVGQWWHDPNFSHGFFVPLFSAFVLWQERDRLSRVQVRPSWLGLVILALALGLLIVGQLGAELFLARFSFLLLIAGGVILFLGWDFFRATFFPWAFLLLMIPIPNILFNQITFPLQIQASKVSAFTLPLFGVPILREGNVIVLPAMRLEVAEACSGIRSLMSLATLAIIYGYLSEKRIWVRWALAIASIPIAIVANSIRIIGTGLLVQYWDPDKAEGYFHASWGWIIFVVSLLLLYAVHSLIRMIWREKEVGA